MAEQSVAQLTTYRSVEEVSAEVDDCLIDGVLYHRCGAGRKNQTVGAVEPCGELKPHTRPYFHANQFYPPNAHGECCAITCAACVARHKAKKPLTAPPRRPQVTEDASLTLECTKCGAVKPRTNEHFDYSNKAARKLANECKVCRWARDHAQRAQTTYTTQTPRDKAIVPDRVGQVTVEGRGYAVGWVGEAKYWPVKPFVVEGADMDWSAQYKRIQNDPQLKSSIAEIAMETPAGLRPTLCLPWTMWHGFWMGTNSPKAERFRRDAYEALALVFGDTAEEVLSDTPVAERVAAAGQRVNGALSALPLDKLITLSPWFAQRDTAFAAERTAEEVAARVVAEAEQGLAQAAELRRQAEVYELQAQQRKNEATTALDAVRQRREQVEAELQREYERLIANNVSQVYIHGPPNYRGQMLVDVKGGQTMNPPARDKALRAGVIKNRFLLCKPTEEPDEAEDALIAALCVLGGRKIGNDHVENVPSAGLDRFIAYLSAYTVLTVTTISEALNNALEGRTA